MDVKKKNFIVGCWTTHCFLEFDNLYCDEHPAEYGLYN